jgi:sulfopyruvate decarboxylase subunit beta
MRTSECFKLLKARWKNELVVCTLGTATLEWYGMTKDDRTCHMHTMGLAASFALGLALTRPNTPVWLLDSDGSLSMSMGSILAEARHRPNNLVHFVVDNGAYQVIGGYPVVNGGRTDFVTMAKGAGVENAFQFEELDAFESALDGILNARKHNFVVLRVPPEPGPRVAVPIEGAEFKYHFGRYMERQEGVTVFGPYGY